MKIKSLIISLIGLAFIVTIGTDRHAYSNKHSQNVEWVLARCCRTITIPMA